MKHTSETEQLRKELIKLVEEDKKLSEKEREIEGNICLAKEELLKIKRVKSKNEAKRMMLNKFIGKK